MIPIVTFFGEFGFNYYSDPWRSFCYRQQYVFRRFCCVSYIYYYSYFSNIYYRFYVECDRSLQASFKRIQSVLFAETKKDSGTVVKDIVGLIEVRNLTVVGGDKRYSILFHALSSPILVQQ